MNFSLFTQSRQFFMIFRSSEEFGKTSRHVCSSVCPSVCQQFVIYFFSSPEPKAQVSYCHPFSSVVRRPLTFYIFIFFSRTGWRISTKLGGDHPQGVGTQSCSYGGGGPQGGPGAGPQRVKRGQTLKIFFSRTKSSRVMIFCMQIPLQMKNIVCSRQMLGWPPWAPRGVQTLREGAKGKFFFQH